MKHGRKVAQRTTRNKATEPKVEYGNEAEKELLEQLEIFTNPVKEGSEEENMLYELLLKSGFDLNSKVEHKGNYCMVNGGEMVVVLGGMSEKL